MKKICIFVDGENFRYSINDLFEDLPAFHGTEYLPKSAKWAEFFDWLVTKTSDSGERLRTYWYVVESIDYNPFAIDSARLGGEVLKRVLSRHYSFRKELEELEGEALTEKMKEMVDTLTRRQGGMRKRSEGWSVLQDGISKRHDSIEFRRAGSITYDLFNQKFRKEKAVDVKLATDLIVLNGIYDIGVIVSGDQDYVPAVKAVKDWGKKIVNVAFRTQDGNLLPGGARRLNEVTDRSIEVSYKELQGFLNL
ncbi:MAG: NYN domain-containing protein [Desulfobaccales bacterium]